MRVRKIEERSRERLEINRKQDIVGTSAKNVLLWQII